jgi:hypothetical protein
LHTQAFGRRYQRGVREVPHAREPLYYTM